MLNGEVIERVQSLFQHGLKSQNKRLSDEHVLNAAVSMKARIVKQRADKNNMLSDWMYSDLPCIPMSLASLSDCSCLPFDIPDSCKILRSDCKLPSPISESRGYLIDYVSSIDGSDFIPALSLKKAQYQKGNKYTSDEKGYFIEDGYLWYQGRKPLYILRMNGLFEDDGKVDEFNSACCAATGIADPNACLSMYDREFKADLEMIPTIVKMAYDELLNFERHTEDSTNNSRDNTVNKTEQ